MQLLLFFESLEWASEKPWEISESPLAVNLHVTTPLIRKLNLTN